MERVVDDLGSEEVLAAVEATYQAQRDAEVTLFRFAYRFATIHNGDSLTGSGRVLPGTERAIRLGGAGTPAVAEFACVQLGARMQLGWTAAKHYVADALDVWHRLPRIAARVEAGEVRVGHARHVARETRHLSKQAAAQVDADMAEVTDGRLPWGRFCDRLAARIVAADPDTAAAREAEARQRQFARACRGSEDGLKGFFTRAPIAYVVRFDATVAYLAEALKALGDTDPEDARRVKAWVILANPTQAVELMAAFAAHRAGVTDPPLPYDDPPNADPAPAADGSAPDPAGEPVTPLPFRPSDLPGWLTRLATGPTTATGPTIGTGAERTWTCAWGRLLPTATVYVHLAQETLTDGHGVLRWEGEGPLSFDYLRDQIAPYQSLVVKPVLDLAGQEPVDAYEIPHRHREAVHLRTPADCFPYSPTTTRRVDVDHNKPFTTRPDGTPTAAGQSRMDNYAPLGRSGHRVKTHGHWTLRQPFDGIYLWRDPSGVFYLVDHTGTRKVDTGRAAATTGTPPGRPIGASPPDLPDIHVHETDTLLDVDFTCA